MVSKNNSVVISDHAVVRYLQRVKGMDVDAIRAEMVSDETKVLIEQLGTAKIPIHNQARLVVVNKTVVTVNRR